jgi:hypothetical protein
VVSDHDTKSKVITHVQSNPWCQDAVMTKLRAAVPSNFDFLNRNLLYVTF